MGMYDTIYCNYPLPDKEIQEYSFQTKDLDEGMDTYLIDEEGELLLIKRLGDDEELDEAIVIAFHGKLTMYSSLTEQVHEPPVYCEDEYGEEYIVVRRTRYEYVVIFTEGVLTRIEHKEEPSAVWSLKALDGSYMSSISCDYKEFERLLAIELTKPDNRRIVIEEEPEPEPVLPSYTIADIPSELLDKIKKLRIDRFIEKHEGPWEWESFLKYDDACLVHLKAGSGAYRYSVLLPFAERHKTTFEEVLCTESSDMLTLFFVCPSLAGMEGEKDNRRWSSFCAICREVPAYGLFDDTTLYVAILLHEVYLSEPEMGDNWAFRQIFRS